MNIIDIIEYKGVNSDSVGNGGSSNGDNNIFIYKHEREDFNTLSQLVVRESQEALLFLDGKALDLFGPGRHTLHTKNIPLLRKILSIPTDGVTPFKCEVYFINTTEQMGINWGIGDVNFRDPLHNDYAFKIGSSGEMSLKITDLRKIITKLVGTEKRLDQETIKRYFKTPITMHIKTLLPNILREKNISIFDVETCLPEISEILKVKISDEMSDYGVSLEKFWINTVLKPENDQFYISLNRQRGEKVTLTNQGEIDMQRAEYNRQVNIIDHTGEIQKRRMDIDTKKYEQEQLGFTYQEKRSFDVMGKFAENEGSGSDLRNAAINLGVGVKVGEFFGNIVPIPPVCDIDPPSAPGVASADSGEKKALGDMSVFENRINKIKMMREKGLLTEEEFEREKQKLLEQI